MAFLVGGANTLDTGYTIENSWRGNGSNSYFNRTLETPTSQRTWTFSAWTKRVPGTDSNLISFGPTAQYNDFRFNADDKLAFHIDDTVSGTSTEITPVFRDPAAWYHIVLAVDTTQGTASNRVKFYVNGTQITDFDAAIYPAEDYDFPGLASGQTTQVGTRSGNDFGYTTGYLADVAFVDGTQLTPSSFGETNDNGVWIPIKPSPTWGNSGFFLEFKQTGTSADASGKGADTSGNGNHFDDNNADVYDITTDTPTNNFCLWNALEYSGDTALAEGNTEGYTRDGTADYHEGARGTIAVSNGKWYWEVKMVEVGDTSNALFAGIMSADHSFRNGEEDELLLGTYGMRNSNGDSVISNGSALAYATYGASFSDGDILNFALDMDNNRLYIGKGGSWADGSGNIDEASINSYLTLSTTPSAYMPMVIGYSTGADIKYQANFGNPPFSISSGNSDGNGYGNFEYAVPSGYYALCTKNLAEFG